MSGILDLLLRPETVNVRKNMPRARYELPRLTELYGEPFLLELQGVPYGRALELRDMADSEVQTVLAGDASGVWKSAELQKKQNAATPAELVIALLLPGEIRAVAVAVEQLSGYRKPVLKPVEEAPPSLEAMVQEDIEKN